MTSACPVARPLPIATAAGVHACPPGGRWLRSVPSISHGSRNPPPVVSPYITFTKTCKQEEGGVPDTRWGQSHSPEGGFHATEPDV